MLGGMASLGLLAGGGRLARAQAAVRLRMTWWGTKERADRTTRVSALYSQLHPNVSVDSENMGWSDYWPKLATQVVGRNAPDLIQMDYRYLF
ncbi:MAG: ABC transporter ATP-binding protein, partial [Azospirillum brasilense]